MQYDMFRIAFRNRSIFDNRVHNNMGNAFGLDIDYRELVEVAYDIVGVEPGNFDMNIQIPRINIDDERIHAINENIRNTYIPEIIDFGTDASIDVTLNISYVAYINEGVLSVVINSLLTEGVGSPQRLIIRTINIDLDTFEILDLEEVLRRQGINIEELQARIDREIEDVARGQEGLDGEDVSVFLRNPNDLMYRVENINNFFVGEEGHLFIVFSYGNSADTNMFDLVVI